MYRGCCCHSLGGNGADILRFKKQEFLPHGSICVIAFLDTFYLCVFDPQNFGWSVAYTFSGVAVGIAVLVAFDTVLWPDPAEPKLLHSLADTLDRQRERLAAIGRAYFDQALQLNGLSPPVSILPMHLPLLERARREINNPQREAILLAAVTITERLHIEIEHCWRSRAITSHETSARVCGRRLKQCFKRLPQRFSSMPVRPPQA